MRDIETLTLVPVWWWLDDSSTELVNVASAIYCAAEKRSRLSRLSAAVRANLG